MGVSEMRLRFFSKLLKKKNSYEKTFLTKVVGSKNIRIYFFPRVKLF